MQIGKHGDLRCRRVFGNLENNSIDNYNNLEKHGTEKKVGTTDEILNIMHERKEAKNENNKKKYKKLNKLIKKEYIKASEMAVRKVQRIGGNAQEQKNKIYEGIRELSNSKTKSPAGGRITSKDGNILFETEEIKKI